jgi:hypothetical protein
MVASCCCCCGNAGVNAAASCAPVDGTAGALSGSSSGNSRDGQITPTAALLDNCVPSWSASRVNIAW